MGFGEAIASVLKNYVTFSGRAPRSEYWYWTLFLLIIGIAAAVIDAFVFPGSSSSGNGPATLVTTFGLLLPNISVSIRRLHDIDRTGWWVLIAFTIIGIILLLVWACTKGTTGPNRFGPDPLPAQ